MLPTETGISSGLMSHLARMQTLPAYIPDAEFSASSLWCCLESKTQGKPKAKYVLPKPRLNEKRFHTEIISNLQGKRKLEEGKQLLVKLLGGSKKGRFEKMGLH